VYFPATHSTHVPPLGPDEPALHVQSSAESLPDSVFAKAGQLEHVESDIAPDVIEYLPAAHSVQLLDEAEDENDPAEHETQVEAVKAPVAAECVPAWRSSARNICGVCVCVFVCVYKCVP
jgi:hypothetical protein